MEGKSQDQRYADLIKKRLRKAEELTDEVFERVEINRNLYKGILDVDDTYEWDYALVDNQMFPLIRNYIARTNPSMTKIRLEGREPGDLERRQINQDFVNWEIGELPIAELLTRGFYSAFLAGNAYFKTSWLHEKRVVMERNNIKYTMNPLKNRATLDFVKFNNLLIPNRNIPTIEGQPYVIELMQMSVGDMIKDNEIEETWDEDFIEWLREHGVSSRALNYEAEFVTDADENTTFKAPDGEKGNRTPEEMAFRSALVQMVCMYTIDGERYFVPLIDEEDRVVNVNRDNPYWLNQYPYLKLTTFPEDDEFYPMSVADAVGDTQITSTEVRNQLLTNIRSLNNNMWISGAPAATTPDYMFKQRPSGIIRVAGDTGQVVPIRPNDGTRSMLEVSRDLQAQFERTGGISSLYSSGAPSKAVNQTARGAQIIDSNIDTNVQMIMDLFGEQVLKKMGDHFLALNAQYVTEEQSFAITGKRGVRELHTISPELVSANFDVFTYPEAMIKQTPASRQASLQNFLTVLNTQVIPTGVQVDTIPVVEALIDSYPEMENIEDIVMSIDEKGARDIKSLERGQMPDIKVRDPHLDLIQIVSLHYEEFEPTYDEMVKGLFTDYVERHIRYLQSEADVQAMVQPPQPQVPGAEQVQQQLGTDNQGVIPETMGTPETQGYNLGVIA